MDSISKHDKMAASVLITELTYLIGVFFFAPKNKLVTVDIEFMARIWSLETGQVEQTLILRKPHKQLSVAEQIFT